MPWGKRKHKMSATQKRSDQGDWSKDKEEVLFLALVFKYLQPQI